MQQAPDPSAGRAPPTEPGAYEPEQPKVTSAMAIVALVLAIVGVGCAPVALVGLVLALVALGRIENPQNHLQGRGIALAGAVVGGVAMMLSIVALLIGILLPALGAARRTARQMQSNTNIRGIHQGMVMHAQGNGSFFPGLDASGNATDLTVEGRYKIMLDGGLINGEYAISPVDTGKTEWLGGGVTSDNYSFAMLKIEDANGGRRAEWGGATFNSQAVVISDRNTGADSGPRVSSVHTDTDSGDWRGSVAWNDNHVEFDTTHEVQTMYVQGQYNDPDNLFEAAGPIDAMMIYKGQ